MSTYGNKRKDDQLGMPHGTAVGRLKKLILFDLIKETGKDTCFRCGEKIASVDDLSIEHKIAWLDNDPALFWSIENIAFSHIRCNFGSGRRSAVRRSHVHLRTHDQYKICKVCGVTSEHKVFRTDSYICNQCAWTTQEKKRRQKI